MMDSRLLTPYAPTMFLLALVAVVGIGERSAAARTAVACMFLVAIPTLLRPEILAEGVRRFVPTWQASARNPRSYPYPLVGNMPEATVADIVRTGDVVALEAGGLPAFILLDTRIIELQGLTDRQLARASVDSVADPQFGKRNWVEVLRRRPHFIKCTRPSGAMPRRTGAPRRSWTTSRRADHDADSDRAFPRLLLLPRRESTRSHAPRPDRSPRTAAPPRNAPSLFHGRVSP